MIKEFKANPDEKEKLAKLRSSDDEKVASFRKAKKITGIFVAVSPILMLLYGFLFPSVSILSVETGDYGNKNVLFIILFAISACAISLYIHILMRELLFKTSGYNIIDRLDESLFLDGTELEYGYHLRDSINIRDRTITHFDLLSMKKIIYNSKFERLSIWGKFHAAYYANYLERRIEKEGDMDIEDPYDIYLYFEPDLLAELQGRGIQIEVV